MEQVMQPGAPPIGAWHSSIYDSHRSRLVVFGGMVDHGDPTSQAWALSLVPAPAWSRIEASGGTFPRKGHAAIYDPLRDRMLIYGGSGGPGGNYTPVLRDLWTLSFSGTPVARLGRGIRVQRRAMRVRRLSMTRHVIS